MSRLSKVSSLRANRIHTSFVNKMSNSSGVNPITPVEKIEPTKNPTKHSTENHLSSFDYYYEKQLRSQTSSLIQKQPKSIEDEPENEPQVNEVKELFIKFIKSYNQLILTLKHSDQLTCDQYTARLHQVYDEFAESLELNGIVENEDYLLTFNEHRFNQLKDSNDCLKSEVISDFMKQILEQYQFILRDKEAARSHSNPYDKVPIYEKGLLIEERL
ncbi:hypothetical protein RYX56_11710 [Alkalihalophilus lindianensis]|uniref:Uncharacterized protein n=1 Tax=Alkalihalophilus lindianensis TaxID=1630542 RepID=A0ABU3XBP2_9BACI|nr:hypothetical protein [Alkalihalophilus lindianensis]MDV2685037.1 hypothetical protein [Alkalihalophilus lindianensis]